MLQFDQTLNETLNDFKEKNQLYAVSMQELRKPITIEHYEKWLDRGFHGTMSYLADHLALKKDPQSLSTQLNSVITVACSYFPLRSPYENKVAGRVALYAQNTDYHFWLKSILNSLIEQLKTISLDQVYLPFVDSGPVLERDLAYQSGIGWFGKNTCIIHPQNGSLFFVAEIFTSLKSTTPDSNLAPLPDFCGTCTKCIEICPTGALAEPRVLDANKCISYLTIESKTAAPVQLRPKMGDWFFGCDLCQTVCPWNQKFFKTKNISESDRPSFARLLNLSDAEHLSLVEDFRFLLTASHNEILRKIKGTPLMRAGAKQLKRNALVVIANRKLVELKSEVQSVKGLNESELVDWVLGELS